MANDPAFLFYPGDYLRDTQCLSEAAQVAYDRIMCEHMRNICISQAQLNFFTKRLTEDEKDALKFVLKEIAGGFMISWVAESIIKRREYGESRRNNRKKTDKPKKNISGTYDEHMENANEIENEIINGSEDGNSKGGAGEKFKSTSETYQDKLELAPYVNALKRGWCEYHKANNKLAPTWGKYDDDDLGSLAKRIIAVCKEKMMIPDSGLMEETMFMLLQEINKNKFMREHITPQLMDKKFNGLMDKIKTKHDAATSTPFD